MLAGKAFHLPEAFMVSGVGIVVVMAELALLAVLVFLLSRLVSTLVNKKTTEVVSEEISETSAAVSVTATGSKAQASCVELYGVDEQTAATIMATVSHQTGIDLKHLDFKSIRLLDTPLELIGVDEPTAAMVMAVVSHQTGIPLERLDFKSIKLIEE